MKYVFENRRRALGKYQTLDFGIYDPFSLSSRKYNRTLTRIFKCCAIIVMKYDREEKSILDAYENGQLKLKTPSKKEIESIKAAANSTFKKNKRITIRLYDHDFKGIQKKAIEMGIPYQTLISGIIHRYIEGDLTTRTG